MALTESVDEIVENSNNPLLGKHDSWERVRLGEIAEIQNGFAFKSAKFSKKEGVPLIRIRDVVKDDTETFYTGEYDPEYMVQPGDLLIGMDGDFNCARWRGSPGVLNQRVCRVTLKSDVLHPRLIDYALPGYLKAINEKTSSVTVKHLSSKTISEIPLPVPPPEQQEQMVAEIEKQFSRLDEAVASLKRVKANLKCYKAAVLKAAVEGKLTEEWRKQNPDVEPASKLLERILAERRTKWEEAELAKITAKGKAPKNDKWKEEYEEPSAPSTDKLPELPEGWQWSTFERLAERVTVGHVGSMKNEYVKDGVPFLRSQNVRENRFDPVGLKFITEKFHKQLSKSSLTPGDLAIVRSGSVGVTCVIPGHLTDANCSDLVIVKQPQGVLSDYGSYYMNSIVNTRVAAGKVGVALVHFNTKSVAEMPVPVPSKDEQRQIINRAGAILSVIESLNRQLDIYLVRSDLLRSSILSRAFMSDTYQ